MTDEITPGFMNYLSELPDNIQWFICDNIKDLSNDNIRVTIANAKTSLPIFLSEYANLEQTEKDILKINCSYFKKKDSAARAIFNNSDASETVPNYVHNLLTSESSDDDSGKKKRELQRESIHQQSIMKQSSHTCKIKVLRMRRYQKR